MKTFISKVVIPEEMHRNLKACAALKGLGFREYLLHLIDRSLNIEWAELHNKENHA